MNFKYLLIILTFIFTLGIGWFFLSKDCINNRAAAGTKVDWAMILDCTY